MMGGPMAENIFKTGHPLVAYDIDKAKLERFIGMGAEGAKGSVDVANRASVMISMVNTTTQSEEVIVGPAASSTPRGPATSSSA